MLRFNRNSGLLSEILDRQVLLLYLESLQIQFLSAKVEKQIIRNSFRNMLSDDTISHIMRIPFSNIGHRVDTTNNFTVLQIITNRVIYINGRTDLAFGFHIQNIKISNLRATMGLIAACGSSRSFLFYYMYVYVCRA